MQSDTVNPLDLIGVLSRHLVLLSVTVFASVLIAVTLALYLPKSFKSKATISINTSYFQNPLVSDLVTEISDPAELKAQRFSILQMALDEKFIDSLGERFGIYVYPANSSERGIERERLREKIYFFSENAASFEISVTANRPALAQKLNQAILERVQEILVKERQDKLSITKTALERHMRTLAAALQTAGSDLQKPDTLQLELQKIEATLASLLLRFTDQHPEVVQLRAKERELQQRVELSTRNARQQEGQQKLENGTIADLVIPSSKDSSQDLYNGLLRKLSQLSIVIDMEKGRGNTDYLRVLQEPTLPIRAGFPSKRIFAGAGLGIGLMLGIVLIVFLELRERGRSSAAGMAEQLDVPYFGELPRLSIKRNTLLIDQPGSRTVRRELPERFG